MSAGSVQGLLGVVRGWGRGRGPAQDLSQVLLALKALVGAVHVLHASRAPPRGPELRTLLEGYFHILNADWPASPSSGPEEALVTLRVSMLGRYGLPGPWEGNIQVLVERQDWAAGEVGCVRVLIRGLTFTPPQTLSP